MTYQLRITPTAFNDLQNAIDYYNSKQSMLGKRFEVLVNDTFSIIKKLPASASFAYDDVRYKVVKNFPYIILYTTYNHTIAILRIFNTHQQPFWTK